MTDHPPSGRLRGEACLYDGRSDWGGQYFARGATITVCIIGRRASTLETEVDEQPDSVGLTIYETHPAAQSPGDLDDMRSATQAILFYSELTIDLKDPLGDRMLVWKPTGQKVPVSQIAKKRQPKDVPADWNRGGGTRARHRETNQRFGPVEVSIMSPYTRSYDRIAGLQNNVNHEMVELLGTEAVWIPRPNGTQRLSFIVDEWFYDLVAKPGVDREDVLAFARSFE